MKTKTLWLLLILSTTMFTAGYHAAGGRVRVRYEASIRAKW